MAQEKLRLTALDGLRGVAILLVILNHVPLRIWYETAGPRWKLWLDFLLVNGKLGVSILFLLTGFLMAWLYPRPKSAISFLAKRYTRLFPAFLVMVAGWTVIKMYPGLPILGQIMIVLGWAMLARLLWELILKLSRFFPAGKFLTYLWIAFQILTAGWYFFYLLKIPSPVFYQTWSNNQQWLVTAMINATLTLPFGNYIGQLDGVYWSLITETFFYILYPILFFPLISYLGRKNNSGIEWFLVLAFPFCLALNFISQRFLATRIMIPYLMIYFVAGAVIGSNIKRWQNLFLGLPKICQSPFGLIPVLFLGLSGVFFYPLINNNWHPLIQILLVIPTGMLLVAASLGEKSWGRWLENRVLVFLGKYSYSLYLTHALVIDLALKIIHPNSVGSSLILLAVVLAGAVALSWCLFTIIEAPYYKLPKVNINLETEEKDKTVKRRFRQTALSFSLIMFLILIWSYRPPFSLLTYIKPEKINFGIKQNITQVGGGDKLFLEFIAKTNNLGMVSVNIKSIKNTDTKDSQLLARLLDSRGNLISQSKFDIGTMVESAYYPFGFPIQTNSKNQKYTIEYQVVPESSQDKVEISDRENSLISVYFWDKGRLLKNPVQLADWFLSKIREPFLSPLFWLSLGLTTPLLLLLLFT